MKSLIWASALAVMLTACGGEGAAKEAVSAPPAGKSYSTIDALVKDALAAGIKCTKVNQPVRERIAADSRYCTKTYPGDDDALNPEADFQIFATDTDLQRARSEAIDFAKLYREMGIGISSILIGPNWIVAGPVEDLKVASKSMGGVVQDLSQVATD